MKIMVRLVRACGSKQPETPEDILASIGQARKSLWIETLQKIWRNTGR